MYYKRYYSCLVCECFLCLICSFQEGIVATGSSMKNLLVHVGVWSGTECCRFHNHHIFFTFPWLLLSPSSLSSSLGGPTGSRPPRHPGISYWDVSRHVPAVAPVESDRTPAAQHRPEPDQHGVWGLPPLCVHGPVQTRLAPGALLPAQVRTGSMCQRLTLQTLIDQAKDNMAIWCGYWCFLD